jgi:hypothetical protein
MCDKKHNVSYKYTISPVTGKWGDVKDIDLETLLVAAAGPEGHQRAWDETKALMKRLAALPIPKE